MKAFRTRYFVFFIVLASIFSCKDYLDLKPTSKLSQADVFDKIEGAQSAIMGVYATFFNYQNAPIRAFGLEADDMSANYAGTLDNAMRSIQRYDLKSSNTWLEPAFTAFYVGIDRANLCLVEIPKMSKYQNGTQEEVSALKRLEGEALTLRAFFFFELVRNWGDVPAPYTPAVLQTDLFLEKTDRHLIYDKILQDLLDAQELLPWRKDITQRDERFTKGSAKALRARVALFAAGYSLRPNLQMQQPSVTDQQRYYEIVKKECLDLIQDPRQNHALTTKFEDVFKAISAYQYDDAGEVLMEVGFMRGASGTIGYFDGPRYYAASFQANNYGGAQVYVLPTYLYAFHKSDLRRDVTVAPYTVDFDRNVQNGTTLAVLPNGKFRCDWMSPKLTSANQNTGINWPLIRFSDVLLMYAEADNELSNGAGPSVIAIQSFEKVRSRAFDGNTTQMGVTPTTYGAFKDAIRNERWFEFGCEGIRKHDLVRWNILSEKIQETKTKLVDMVDRKAPYTNLPNVLYTKNRSEKLTFFIDNSNNVTYDYYILDPSTTIMPATKYSTTLNDANRDYYRVNWKAALSKTALNNVVSTYGTLFEVNKDEIMPLPQKFLNANPKLRQEYGHQ